MKNFPRLILILTVGALLAIVAGLLLFRGIVGPIDTLPDPTSIDAR